MAEIDSLEIKIETSAKSSLEYLDKVQNKLDEITESLKSVLTLSSRFGKLGKIDLKDFEDTKKQLDAITKKAKSISKHSVTPRVKTKEIEQAAKSIDDLFDKFQNAGRNLDLSNIGLSDLEKEADRTEKTVKRLNDRLEKKMSLEGTEKLGKSWESLVYDIQKATNQAELYREAIDKIKSAAPKFTIERGENSTSTEPDIPRASTVSPESLNYDSEAMRMVFGEEAAGLKNFDDVLKKFGGTAAEASIKLNELEESFNPTPINTYEAQIKRLKAELSNLASQGFKQGDIEYDEVAKELARVTLAKKNYDKEMSRSVQADTGTKKFLSSLKDMRKSLLSATSSFAKFGSKASKSLGGVAKTVNKIKNALIGTQKQANGMSFGRMIGSSVAFSFVFQGISAVQRAIKEGSDNLVQYSSVYNNSISSMVSALTYLKNSWAAAFAPIINVVAPYIQAFIDMIASALNTLGRFFAALTGKSTTVQAKKVWQDYGASLSDVGSGAEEAAKGLGDTTKGINDATKAAEEFQSYTLGIDELNVQPQMTETSGGGVDNSGGGTGTGAGSGGGIGGMSPYDMFETVEIEKGISDFAKKVKEAWRNADFTEIGSIIGTKLKSALENIPWEEIQGVAGKLGKSIATLINGFVEVDGLGYEIGETIGKAVNTGVILANNFLDNTHWDSVGKFIGEGLSGIVDSVDWRGIGHFFASKWNAIFETIGEAAKKFKWKKFGKSLSNSVNTFIADFEWAANGTRLSDLAKGLLDSIISFLEKTNWQELGNGVADFIGSIDWTGLVERIAEGIGAAIGGLAALLWGLIEDAWNSVVEWWKETAYEDGKFTIEGLLQGIVDTVFNIGTWIYEHIFEPFVEGFKKAFGINSPSTVMAEQGNFIMEGLFNGISEKFNKIIDFFNELWEKIKEVFSPVAEWFAEKFTSAREKISEAFQPIGKWFQDKWTLIRTIFAPVKDFFKQKFESGYKAILTAFQSINSWFHQKWDAAKNVFRDVRDFFKEKFESAYQSVKIAFQSINSWFHNKWDSVKDVFKDVKSFFESAFKKAYDAVTKIWNNIGSFFKDVANKAISPINALVSGIVDAINWVGDRLGVGAVITGWKEIKFAKGSDGVPQDTLGVVNDQPGSTYKELIVPPHGKPFIPEGRNVMLPLEKGTKIMPADETKEFLNGFNGMPHFAGGIGDFFGNAWSSIKSFTGTVWDYITNPGDLVKIAIDKFVSLSSFFQPWTTIAGGIVNKTFDSIVKYVKGLFDKAMPTVNYSPSAGVEQWRQLAAKALQMTGQFSESNLNLLLYQMQTESGGNPNAINNWDINAINGTPSKGLMQVIDPTFQTHKYPGYDNIWDPLSNMLAAIRYTLSRYGSLANGWKGHGYAEGIGKINVSDLIPKYEVGGFPEDGLFMANHNELVGQFSNGRTAVANNNDIQKGIEEAAYRGFLRASTEGNRREESLLEELIRAVREGKQIIVDGRELVAAYDSRKGRNGFSFT